MCVLCTIESSDRQNLYGKSVVLDTNSRIKRLKHVDEKTVELRWVLQN